MLISIIFLFLLIQSNTVFSAEPKNPIAIFEPPIPSFPESQLSLIPPNIYSLKCYSSYIDIVFLDIKESFTGVLGDTEYNIANYATYRYDLLAKTFSLIEMATGAAPYDPIDTRSDAVILNGKTLQLEDCYQPYTLEEDFTYKGKELYAAILSQNQRWIGGIIRLYSGTQDGHYSSRTYSFGIWNTSYGSGIYQGGYSFTHLVDPAFIEIAFSPNDVFCFSRIVTFINSTGKGSGMYLTPLLSLVNTSNTLKWDAEYDVDFTPDGRYLVTFINGAPSLVNVEKNKIIQQYNIPSHMFAIGISPDAQKVFITCNDNKIYVFDSGIDSACEEWELLE